MSYFRECVLYSIFSHKFAACDNLVFIQDHLLNFQLLLTFSKEYAMISRLYVCRIVEYYHCIF